MCGCSRRLLAHFGGLPALQHAMGHLDTFPKIRLDKGCLGKAWQKHLATYLAEQPAASSGGASPAPAGPIQLLH